MEVSTQNIYASESRNIYHFWMYSGIKKWKVNLTDEVKLMSCFHAKNLNYENDFCFKANKSKNCFPTNYDLISSRLQYLLVAAIQLPA